MARLFLCPHDECPRGSGLMSECVGPTRLRCRLRTWTGIVWDASQIVGGHTFKAVERIALRKLRQLDAATDLGDLASPPGNHLEALKGDRRGQHSIRINDQWRICFVWRDGDAFDVEIVDYH